LKDGFISFAVAVGRSFGGVMSTVRGLGFAVSALAAASATVSCTDRKTARAVGTPRSIQVLFFTTYEVYSQLRRLLAVTSVPILALRHTAV